jgi:hypothetical protein
VTVGLAPEPVKIIEAPVFERWDRRHRSFEKSPLFGDWAHEFECLRGFGFALLRIHARIRGHVFEREAVLAEGVIVVFAAPDEVL